MSDCCMFCVLAIVMTVGCDSRPTTVVIQGEVSYNGEAVEKGRIDFLPIENTPGGSAVGIITAGQYDIPAKCGLCPDGMYLVRVVAYRKTGKQEPNRIDRGGPPVDVEENYIPAIYNSESTLKLRVAELTDKNKVNFQLEAASRNR